MLNKVNLKTILISIAIPLTLCPALLIFNSYLAQILPKPPNSLNNYEILKYLSFISRIFFIAICPGIFEELLFRGFFTRAMEQKGLKLSIFYVGLIFGLFHINPCNLVGPVVLGMVLVYMTIYSNSIFTSMIAHITNNLIAVLFN